MSPRSAIDMFDAAMKVQPSAFRIARNVDRAVIWLAQGVGAVAMAGLFIAVLGGVALRYLTDQGAGWVNELPYLLFPWLCASAFVLAAQSGAHICVEFLQAALPDRAATVLAGAVQLAAAMLFAWLTLAGVTVVGVTSTEFYPILRIPTAWAYGGLTGACALLSLTALTGFVRTLIASEDVTLQRRRQSSEMEVDL